MTRDRRADLLTPHRIDHERSVERKARVPMTLRDYLRELHAAAESETVTKLHQGGVEWEVGAGGSHLGTPRWTAAFRSYVTGSDCDTTADGEWRWPLRSSVFRLSISRSPTDQSAARFVFLLMHNRFHVREAWTAQHGPFALPDTDSAAEAWAMEALRRWHQRYVEQPRGRAVA